MATSLFRLATYSGLAYRSALAPLPRVSLIPSNSLISNFLCTATPEPLATGTPDALGAETCEPFDLEASKARRAAFWAARKEKLEKIADEVMSLNNTEYQVYSALLRDKLCRGEKSLFDVKLKKIEPEEKLNVIRAVLDLYDSNLEIGVDLQRINDSSEEAPFVVKKGVTRHEGEKIVEKLKEAGATAVLE